MGKVGGALAPIKRFGARAVFKVKQKSPEICLIAGIGCGVATVIVACKATLKADEILDKHADAMKRIEDAKEAVLSGTVEGETYGDEEIKKDQLIAKKDLVLGMGKLYAPAVGLGLLSIGLILTSYRIINGRYVGLMGAYTALDDQFKKYKKRVVDAVGEDKEREIRTGIFKKKGYVEEVDEYGKNKVVEKELEQHDPTLDDGDYGDMVVYSEFTSSAWQKNDPYYNEAFLRAQETYFQNLLIARGYVFLIEVKRALGLIPKPEDAIKGWILDPADPAAHAPLSFGIRGPIFRETGDHPLKNGKIVKTLSGKEFVLEFNTDGVMWNLINLWEH